MNSNLETQVYKNEFHLEEWTFIFSHLNAFVQDSVQEVHEVFLCLHEHGWQEVAVIGHIQHDDGGHQHLTEHPTTQSHEILLSTIP